jgi:hypothetical protein
MFAGSVGVACGWGQVAGDRYYSERPRILDRRTVLRGCRLRVSYPTAMREYDEDRELMGYVMRNYPQIVRRRDCVPSKERVRDELPVELRDEYWKHVLECERIRMETYETERRLSVNGSVMDILPIMPEMRPELAEAWSVAFTRLEKQAFWVNFLPHKDDVFIHRCARCQRVLVNEQTCQCLWCGAKWH